MNTISRKPTLVTCFICHTRKEPYLFPSYQKYYNPNNIGPVKCWICGRLGHFDSSNCYMHKTLETPINLKLCNVCSTFPAYQYPRF